MGRSPSVLIGFGHRRGKGPDYGADDGYFGEVDVGAHADFRADSEVV